MNTAFEKWANNYFGEYLACLLETGELPSIGGAPGDSGICNELFEPFDIANGRTRKTSSGEGDGGDGSDKDQLSRGGSGDGGGVRESSASSRGSYVSSSSSRSFRSSRRGGSFNPAQNISKKDKSKYTGSTETSSVAGVGYSQTHSDLGRPQYISLPNRRLVDVSDTETETSKKSGNVKRDNASAQDKRRIQLRRKEVSKTTIEEDKPLTFGNFLRILIIAAIIIALVVLLGGQALQISKNSD